MARSRLREYLNADYQPGERKLVQKIDFFILTFCCLSYFTNYVSPNNSKSRLCHASMFQCAVPVLVFIAGSLTN